MQQKNFYSNTNEPTNCWAEFSIEHNFCILLDDFFEKLKTENPGTTLKKPNQHHVSLLYGYSQSESAKLLEITQEHFLEPLTLTVGKVRKGDVSPVVLLHINPSKELDNLFWDLYNNVGPKKHTLIDGKYDPHITLAISDSASIACLDIEKFSKALEGKSFTIDRVLSYDEDAAGKNILLGEYNANNNSLSNNP